MSSSNHHTFDTFIFDLDGTLLDTMPDLVVVTNKTLEHFGYPTHSYDEILSYVGSGAARLIDRAVPEDTSPERSAEALAYWRQLYPEIGLELTKPYENMGEALAQLKACGCKLAVLSNKYEGGVKDVIPLHFPDVFEVLHGECEGIPRKPDPAGLLRTIRELESAPERTAYIGDSSGDMLVAHRAGAFAIGVDWGYNPVSSLEEAEADVVLSDPMQLLDFAPADAC